MEYSIKYIKYIEHLRFGINTLICWVKTLIAVLFFPGRDWSGVWLRLDARRLAVPKDPRFGPPPDHKNIKI